MRRYDLDPGARQDVLDLFDYVRSYDEAAEARYADALVECFERLAEFPHFGSERPELAPGLRSVPVRRLRLMVFYFPLSGGQDRVRVVRVLRQERDVSEADFEQD